MKKTGVLLILLFIAGMVAAQQEVYLIPKPAQVSSHPGIFKWNSRTRIITPAEFKQAALLFADLLNLPSSNVIVGNKALAGVPSVLLSKKAGRDTTAYTLSVNTKLINVQAGQIAGMFSALQTLAQLALTQSVAGVIPCVEIRDQARFGYRGLMLDVSRNFVPVSFVKKMLDLMSLYKLNRLHLHLSDAAGWRLEITKYPGLTRYAAWRTRKTWKEWWAGDRQYGEEGSPMSYGGYYTQADARELVRYAQSRGIVIIPEIEMPGHSEEVIATYPGLGCVNAKPGQGEFCLGNDSTFTFLQDVLTEVMSIFPSTYIHVGGDEAGKSNWNHCPRCQQRIRDNHLKDEHELQSYAIRRMEAFLSSKGRKLLGWDEILEGGLAPGATVMSWRGEQGGIDAARLNHEVIMTPGSYCYFDQYQQDPITQPEAIGGFLPLQKVYSYEPVPSTLEADKAHFVLGAQANVWTEYMPNADHLEYMIFPRIIALSETVWSTRESRNWDDFKARLYHHYGLLQRRNVNYCRPSDRVEITQQIDPQRRESLVQFGSEQFQPEIRYTTDGSEPAANSQLYAGPFTLRSGAIVRAAIFRDGRTTRKADSIDINFHKALGKRVLYNKPYNSSYPAQKDSTLVNGYRGSLTYQDGQWQGFTNDLDITIDLGRVENLSRFRSTFMQLIGPGVYLPDYIELSVSTDGNQFVPAGKQVNDVPATDPALIFKTFDIDLKNIPARYIRFFARNHDGFLFADEAVVE